MRAKSALTSTFGPAGAAFVVGWLACTTLLRPRGQRPLPPPALPALPESQPEPTSPALALQQRVTVQCGGVTFEGIINSIYVEDGQARITLIDRVPDPLNTTLWTWEDEGTSEGR